MQTPYDVLGVSRKASGEAIRTAFCKVAKACHPDLNSGDQAKERSLKQVIAAYKFLKNTEQRSAYDRLLAEYEQYLRSRRRQTIQRFAAVPVAALVSGGIVALGVSLWTVPPHASGFVEQRSRNARASEWRLSMIATPRAQPRARRKSGCHSIWNGSERTPIPCRCGPPPSAIQTRPKASSCPTASQT